MVDYRKVSKIIKGEDLVLRKYKVDAIDQDTQETLASYEIEASGIHEAVSLAEADAGLMVNSANVSWTANPITVMEDAGEIAEDKIEDKEDTIDEGMYPYTVEREGF